MQNQTIEGYRLSPQQKHLWSLQKDSYAYRTQVAVYLEGEVKVEVLKKALHRVTNQHEILRTTFHRLPGIKTPIQVITDSCKLSWKNVSLCHLAPKEREAKIKELLEQERHFVFDLEQGPLLHLSLLELSANQQILLVSMPSLCADSWSLQNLIQEISNAYAACLEGEELSNEPVQYLQFSEWQNELLEEEEAEPGRSYWHQQDIGSLPALTLPFEKKSSEQRQFTPDIHAFKFEPYVVAKLEANATLYNTTIAGFLLACWQTLLWRLTGQSDIVVSTVFNGRKYEELHETLGLLAKWLPVHCPFQENFQFTEILSQIGKTFHNHYKWQEYFLWEISKELIGDNENFPVSFEFEEWPNKSDAGGVSFSLYQRYVCFELFKVKLTCVQTEESTIAEFNYDASLFSGEDIERLAEQFLTLVESAARNPEATVGELEILSKRDRRQLLVEFNNTQTHYPQNKCIHQLFKEQVERTPDQIAVVFENQQLTYAELNARANQLAHYLQQLGIEPEVLVGLYAERSLEIVIGLLGILKAGGAYLPLDPALPAEGLAFRLQDAQSPVLLTQQSLAKTLPQLPVQIVSLDADWHNIAQSSDANPRSITVSNNLAYVLFTSGSTGMPKGVAVEHGQLLNYIYGITDRLDLPTGSSFATVSTFAADLGNTSIFSALCMAGCLHVVSQERASDPEALADYFSRYPIDCLKIVPSHLATLLASSTSRYILPHRRLILGGEAASWELIETIQQQTPNCQIFNHYGPTETTVGALAYHIENKSVSNDTQTVPIGCPLANIQTYVLDQKLQPVPIGVPGELYISGEGLARSYFNRPELTSERFLPNPFVNGTRLYKTGDVARYLPDGKLEFIGRIDNQIKVRGFRIEPGEIETLLGHYSGVRQSAVIVREEQQGNKRLVAYVVPNPKYEPSVSDLRHFLSEKLAEFMIPSVFVKLKSLPLTPNGKVDRRALPSPEQSRMSLEEYYVAPRTPLEEQLTRIWAKILGVERVGIHDNFFELGGDSILSIQIVAEARKEGLQLMPKQLFQHQTIAELTPVLGTAQTNQTEQGMVTGAVPLTPIQHWFFEQNLPEPYHWNQAVLLQTRELLEPGRLGQVVQYLIQYHDALRLRFFQKDGTWQQYNADFDGIVLLTHLDLSALPEVEKGQAIEQASISLQGSLNFSQGPLLRIAQFNLGTNRSNRLLIVIHHLAVDGVSWRILLEDFQTLYQQLQNNETLQLPEKTTSFQQWSESLQEYVHSEEIQEELDYWLTTLSRVESSSLPVDYASDKNTEESAQIISVTLTKQETESLLREVPAKYRTQINEILLTAFVQTFAQEMDMPTLLINLEGHGREEIIEGIDLSRTVGWFTSIFPVYLDLTGISNPGEAIKTVKEQLRQIPNNGIGYGLLRYLGDAQVMEKLKAFPQPEVSFNYLGQFDQTLAKSPLFQPSQESKGSDRSLQGERSYLLDVNGLIVGEQLQVNWIYSQAIHKQTTIENLAQGFIEALRSLITHCQSSEGSDYTPSDFPQMNLNQEELNKLLEEL